MELDIISYPDPYPLVFTPAEGQICMFGLLFQIYITKVCIKLVPIPLRSLLNEKEGEKLHFKGKNHCEPRKIPWYGLQLFFLFIL